MKKRFFLWVMAVLPLGACSILEVGALNPHFLDPIHSLLFKNEFQVNDFQYLFDASNQTVSIKSRRSSETVDGIYALNLAANPSSQQGIYRLEGSKSYNNLYLGLEYTQVSNGFFSAKIVIQESLIKTQDALNTWTTNVYVNSSLGSPAYYKVAAAGTWARVSATGIYNGSATDHFTFVYNELVDTSTLNAVHTAKVSTISGGVTNTSTYSLAAATNLTSSSAVFVMNSTDPNAPLNSRYVGFDVSGTSAGGIPHAKIITSTDSTISAQNLLNFIILLQNSVLLDYTTLSSVERPDLQLIPLRSKGPWVAVNGNSYNQLNTTNWDFSIQDQSVTITVYTPSGGASPISQSFVYSLKTTDTLSVLQLSSTNPSAPYHNYFFAFKFRIRPGETIERASFYLESTENQAINQLRSPNFADNYVNIYAAGSLGGAISLYQLQVPATLKEDVAYSGKSGLRDPLYGATVFTREDNRQEFIYVLGGANNANVVLAGAGATASLFELGNMPTNPFVLRLTLARTADFGETWQDIPITVSGYPTTEFVAPFGGQYAWVGSRLFVYNPAKFANVLLFDALTPATALPAIPSSYRLISTSTFANSWTMATLPGELTNRVHASFFSSQSVLVLAGGMHFTENSHKSGSPAGSYTITNDVWQSYNSGATWFQVSKAAAFSPRYMATTLAIGSDVFLMGGYSAFSASGAAPYSKEIWKSSDNGATWTLVGGELPPALVGSYTNEAHGRAPGFVINSVMYLVAADTKIYSSADGGKTWKEENKVDVTAGGGTSDRSPSSAASAYVWSVNNAAHKGELFQIGGINALTTVPAIDPNAYRRELRAAPAP